MTKRRQVYLVDDMAHARHAADVARACGMADDNIRFVARPDIEIRRMDNSRKVADSDFTKAALRGAAWGGIVGMVASFVALGAFEGMRWWGVLPGVAMGAMVGAWASSLVGASIADPVHRRFTKEIAAGNVLVVIDAEEPVQHTVEIGFQHIGARKLDYDEPAAIS